MSDTTRIFFRNDGHEVMFHNFYEGIRELPTPSLVKMRVSFVEFNPEYLG